MLEINLHSFKVKIARSTDAPACAILLASGGYTIGVFPRINNIRF